LSDKDHCSKLALADTGAGDMASEHSDSSVRRHSAAPIGQAGRRVSFPDVSAKVDTEAASGLCHAVAVGIRWVHRTEDIHLVRAVRGHIEVAVGRTGRPAVVPDLGMRHSQTRMSWSANVPLEADSSMRRS
jgi:hypothetical protein